MSRWFRFYAEVLNDPKVQRLDGETFKAWINILCIASQNDGKLPPVSDIAFALRLTEDGALTVLERLSNATLIDRVSGGPDGYHYAPHGWAKRQYKSYTSTERVKRFRERSATVTVTPPDTDTDTDTEQKKKTIQKKTAIERPGNVSEQVWSDFLSQRKQLKADLTVTALEGIKREADKIGWSLEQALVECTVRGWRGFKADWIKEKTDGSSNRTGGVDRRSSLARAIDEGLDLLG